MWSPKLFFELHWLKKNYEQYYSFSHLSLLSVYNRMHASKLLHFFYTVQACCLLNLPLPYIHCCNYPRWEQFGLNLHKKWISLFLTVFDFFVCCISLLIMCSVLKEVFLIHVDLSFWFRHVLRHLSWLSCSYVSVCSETMYDILIWHEMEFLSVNIVSCLSFWGLWRG